MGKAFRSGFYWPTTKQDAQIVVRVCPGCQFFARQQHQPASVLNNIPVSWPFACLGLDMIGPFKKAPGGYDHMLVAVDKFTKWIEYKPIGQLTAKNAIDFIEEIIHRFGIPTEIITDLGTNFTGGEFREYCERCAINIRYASVSHPKAKGQVERANGLILHGLKPRIFDRLKKFEGKWLQQLPYTVWRLRTQPSKAIGGHTLPSSWFTALMQLYQQISSTAHP